MEFESWQITDFNIKDRQIKLGNKFGLVKIIRSDDGILVLVGDSSYGMKDPEKPAQESFVRPESILGFVLDIGIQKEKTLSHGNGFYFGTRHINPQSPKVVSQDNFDEHLFERLGNIIDSLYQSGDKQKETEAIKLQLLFDTYNNARLLFPNFYAESYLGLMRILDALCAAQGRYDFAAFVANISFDFNHEIYQKLRAVGAFNSRISVAMDLFDKCLQACNRSWECYDYISNLDDAGKIIFSCFYSAYQYRSKFVHHGFPFPDTVKEAIGLSDDFGMAYLNPAEGISWIKIHRPDGLQDGDLIDIHTIVSGKDAEDFKDKYFKLLPTWHFLKLITRKALMNHVERLVYKDNG